MNCETFNLIQPEDLPNGEWTGYFVENGNRGWMHLYFHFHHGQLKAEGTDQVGMWVAQGQYNLHTARCDWIKHYLGQHKVDYFGQINKNGICGSWSINSVLSGPFQIWPRSKNHLHEDLFLR